MELELTRINYGSVNTTLPNCLKLVSTEKQNKQQKIAVGDLDGNFQMFGIKKSEAQLVFQNYVGSKVSSVQISGVSGSTLDKIFVASDNVIKAFTKKGKMFLSFDVNLTEPIKCMYVSGADLFICGNHVYSHYRDCKEIGTYLCGDTILDVVALFPNNTNRILTILACSGRVLRILEHCRVRQMIEVDSVPNVLHVFKNALDDQILCGFTDGKIILYQFGHFTGEIKQRTLIDVTSSPSAVICMDTYDLSRDERDELIVGRRDGTVQVFTMPLDEVDVECREIYKEKFSESISAVHCGCVFSKTWSEIVVVLYSGIIFGLTTQTISFNLTNKEIVKLPSALKKSESASTSKAQDEVSDGNVQKNLVKTLESSQWSTIQSNITPALTVLQVNDSLTLDKNDKTYNLFIELPIPISEIVIESDVTITIITNDQDDDYSIENVPQSDYDFARKITMNENCNSFGLKFQTLEGQYGTLQALIVPYKQSHNIQNRSYIIRPLSLHLRCHTLDASRPLNVLSLKGLFSHSEMHNWIAQCIPEVPERLATTETSDLFFENCLIGTILECKYGKGKAEFRSDNLSTISILKDFLTKEATKKRIKLEINTNISELSVAHVLKLIENSIMDCIQTKKDYIFLQALLQVDINSDEDFQCLMPEYQSILKRKDQINADYKKSQENLDKYFGVITDYYIDRFKFKGVFVKEKIPMLLEILENFNMNKLLEFFDAAESKEI